MEMMERITVGEINKYINVFYGKNRNVWVRGGGPGPEYEDCSLYDFIRRIAPNHGVQVEQENEELDWQMCDMLADGAETKEGLIAFFYAAAIQATEMRERLRMIEEILCGDKNEFDIDRLRELIQADKDGRCVIYPFKPGEKVYFILNEKPLYWLYKPIMVGYINDILTYPDGEIRVVIMCDCSSGDIISNSLFTVSLENVMRTREDAEAALAALKEAKEK